MGGGGGKFWRIVCDSLNLGFITLMVKSINSFLPTSFDSAISQALTPIRYAVANSLVPVLE